MMEFSRDPGRPEPPLSATVSGLARESVKTYHGQRRPNGTCEVWVEEGTALPDGGASVVFVDRHPLPLRLDLREHSPTGFAWGYGGSDPAQLALALLADALGDGELTRQHYQHFKEAVVANWRDHWTISRDEIWKFIPRQE